MIGGLLSALASSSSPTARAVAASASRWYAAPGVEAAGSSQGEKTGGPLLENHRAASKTNMPNGDARSSAESADRARRQVTTPMKADRETLKVLAEKDLVEFNAHVDHQRMQRLHYLLEQSTHYSEFLAKKMKQQQEAARLKTAAQAASAAAGVPAKGKRKRKGPNAENGTLARSYVEKTKRPKVSSVPATSGSRVSPFREDEDSVDYLDTAVSGQETRTVNDGSFVSPRQPKLLTGGVMRDYQLRGLEWLISLYENGLNGILADEMGLGKTIQTIAFFAHLWENGVCGPFLIVAPLSTLSNWVSELQRFAPSLPALLYHGDINERANLRRTRLKQKGSKFPIVVTSYEMTMNDRKHLSKFHWKYIVIDEGHRVKNYNCKLLRDLKTYPTANRLLLTGTPLQNNLAELWSLLNFLLPDIFDDLDAFGDWFDFSDLGDAAGAKRVLGEEASNSVVSNLHHILQPFLLRRLKSDVELNLPKKREYLIFAPLTPKQKSIQQAILSRDIRAFLLQKRYTEINRSASSENVSAMDVEPSRINDEDEFQPFMGCSEEDETFTRSSALSATSTRWSSASCTPSAAGDYSLSPVSSSRTVTPIQKNRGQDCTIPTIQTEKHEQHCMTNGTTSASPTPGKIFSRRFRQYHRAATEGINYEEEESDDKYFEKLEEAANAPPIVPVVSKEEKEKKNAAKAVSAMKLQNMIMQLRKACNHPLLFEQEYEIDEDLTTSSGKMLLLDRMLPALLARNHRVLIFSQMTSMLDIIEHWCVDLRGWPVFRIDGNVSQKERQRRIELFNSQNQGRSKEDDVRIFLLSTRAGGLGINLTAADTVIIYDSDWNPQVDLQAQDRVHRIGQTKPVVVYRFVTSDTVEARVVDKANNKRKLEKLVMHKGRFKGDRISQRSFATASIVAELAEMLAAEEREQVNSNGQTPSPDARSLGPQQVLSEEDLERLLDRSSEAYEAAAKAAAKNGEAGGVGARRDGLDAGSGAFRVIEHASDAMTDALATKP